MKIEDVLDLLSPDADITICESDGRPYYTGNIQDAHAFNKLEIDQINVANKQLIITISTNDMLD